MKPVNMSQASKAFRFLLASVFCAMAVPSFAHVSLLEKEAPASSAYTAAFRVSHACKDARSTTGVSIELPAGFAVASAEPRAGWIQSAQAAVSKKGKPSRPALISWAISARDAALPGDQRGDFVLRGTLPAKTGPLWFKVLQTCDVGSVNWAQVPAVGVATEGLASPAARLDVLPTGFAAATVEVRDVWVRSTVPGQAGTGAYMKFTATSASRLVGVSTPAAGIAEIHEMKMEGDIMKMRAFPDGLELPASKTVEFSSGGYHVMLMDLKQPLVNGSKVPMTLTFKDAKGVQSQVLVSAQVSTSAPSGSSTKPDGRNAHQH